ncbi:MAG: cell division protein FtsA [Candidatus Omnitrophica bacterium]|nr:cell division protein FtsA [Candidatus Omnitrophota bacterium]HQP12019.1 cell division protein FtsA [Candidatus Omnitrophota bacterium]
MLKSIMGEKYFCGLDIGAQAIKASLLTAGEHNKPQLLGVFEVGTGGFDHNSVTDLGEFSECVHQAVSGLSNKVGVKIKDVHLGINGELITQRPAAAVIPLLERGTKIIASVDVKKVQSQARLLGVNMEEVILHEIPQYYKVDDVNMAMNPVGLYGRKLEIHTLIIVVHGTLLKNIIKGVAQAGYDVGPVALSTIAAAEASLSRFQKRQGCLLLDVGSSVTNMLVFKDENLKQLFTINWGGRVITQSIARALGIPFGLAEEIKKSYASAVESDRGRDEELLIKKEEGYVPVKRDTIILAIEPVIHKFVSSLKESLEKTGLKEQMNSGIIMIGGGAMLPGLPECIEQRIGLPVKIGMIEISSRRLHNASKFAAAVGLAYSGFNRAQGAKASSGGQGRGAAFLVQKVKEIYLEYF